jgi:uncharacterized membrane protein YfhO
VLVLTDGWDAGWRASLDEEPVRVLRLNHGEMGVVMGPGLHRVAFDYHVPGLGPGLFLAAMGAGALAFLARGGRGRRG